MINLFLKSELGSHMWIALKVCEVLCPLRSLPNSRTAGRVRITVPPPLQMKKPGSKSKALAQRLKASGKDQNSGHLAFLGTLSTPCAASQDHLITRKWERLLDHRFRDSCPIPSQFLKLILMAPTVGMPFWGLFWNCIFCL